jgi:hypothetical protein
MLVLFRSRGVSLGFLAWLVMACLSPLISLHVAHEHGQPRTQASEATLPMFSNEHDHHGADHEHSLPDLDAVHQERSVRPVTLAVVDVATAAPVYSLFMVGLEIRPFPPRPTASPPHEEASILLI